MPADLVLVHGLGNDHTYWDNVVGDLGRTYQVHAVDLPGHGRHAARLGVPEASPRRLAATLIDELCAQGIERPHLVGLSLGGWVVLEMAEAGFGASVVALAPGGLWHEGPTTSGLRRENVTQALLRAFDPLLPALSRRPAVKRAALRGNVVDPDRVTSEQLLANARALARARGRSACFQAMRAARFQATGANQVPTAVAFGDHDEVLPPETCQELSLVPEGATTEIVSDCGHAMSWDQPDRCLALIDEVVARAG